MHLHQLSGRRCDPVVIPPAVVELSFFAADDLVTDRLVCSGIFDLHSFAGFPVPKDLILTFLDLRLVMNCLSLFRLAIMSSPFRAIVRTFFHLLMDGLVVGLQFPKIETIALFVGDPPVFSAYRVSR